MKKILQIYIDESGNPSFSKQGSQFYIISFALFIKEDLLDKSINKIRCKSFHASPLIRGKDIFSNVDIIERRKQFLSMAIFATSNNIKYHSFIYCKKDYENKEMLFKAFRRDLHEFLIQPNNNLLEFETVNFYYDDGQKEISDSLKFIIEALYSNSNVILVNKKTRLFEVADYAGEIALLSQKLKFGYLTKSDKAFFTNKELKNNYIKPLKKKTI